MSSHTPFEPLSLPIHDLLLCRESVAVPVIDTNRILLMAKRSIKL